MGKRKQTPDSQQGQPGSQGLQGDSKGQKKDATKKDESLHDLQKLATPVGMDLGKTLAGDLWKDIVNERSPLKSFLKLFELAPKELFKRVWNEELKRASQDSPLEGLAWGERMQRAATARHVTRAQLLAEGPIAEFARQPYSYLKYSEKEIEPLLRLDFEGRNVYEAGENLRLDVPLEEHHGHGWKFGAAGIKFNPNVDFSRLPHLGNPNRYLKGLEIGVGGKAEWSNDLVRFSAEVQGQGEYKPDKDAKHWPPYLQDLKKGGYGSSGGKVEVELTPNDRFRLGLDFSGTIDSKGSLEGNASLELQLQLEPDWSARARRGDRLYVNKEEIKPPPDKPVPDDLLGHHRKTLGGIDLPPPEPKPKADPPSRP